MKKHWYTNDIEEAMFLEGQEPDGWHRGRAKAICEQISKTEHGKVVAPEVIERIAAKHRGMPSPMKDRSQSEEAKKKIGAASKGRKWSEATRKKFIAARKGKPLSEKAKRNIAKAHKGQVAWNKGLTGFKQSEETKQKKSKALLGHKHSAAAKVKMKKIASDPAHIEKIMATKRLNKTFNSSKPEEDFYTELLQLFNKFDIKRQYKDDRYPFNCDFYIQSLDLFIELNLNWTHGGHKYDANNIADKIKVEKWQEKAKYSAYYLNAVETWTIRDIKKFNIASSSKINYLVAYNKKDINKVLNYLKANAFVIV